MVSQILGTSAEPKKKRNIKLVQPKQIQQSSAEMVQQPEGEREPRNQKTEFTLIESRKKRKKRTATAANSELIRAPDGIESRRLPKTLAVILNNPTGHSTYADMVREIKGTIRQESIKFDITTRSTKSGNLILEASEKGNADVLSNLLKRKYDETNGRCQASFSWHRLPPY